MGTPPSHGFPLVLVDGVPVYVVSGDGVVRVGDVHTRRGDVVELLPRTGRGLRDVDNDAPAGQPQ